MTKRHSLDYIKKVLSDKQIIWTNEKDGYKNNAVLLKLKCGKQKCNYEWSACFANIMNHNGGCSKCKGCLKYSIKDVLDSLNNKNIIWINEKDGYKNNSTLLKLKCAKQECNYSWNASFTNIINQNSGCPKCSQCLKYDINFVKEYCKNRNISVISTEYKNVKSPLNYSCDICNCTWQTTFTSIKSNNNGCPNCASCKTEKLCRKHLEEKFKVKFSKISPEWLSGLQLDGYNEQLNIAFEYNGEQHYRIIPFYHKSNDDFVAQQHRDKLKRKILKEKHIKLIDIPYTYNCKKEDKLYKFIDDQLTKLKITSK